MNKRTPTTKATPARIAALEAVAQCRVRKSFAQDAIARDIDNSSMSEEDRAFAATLVLGVVKTRGILDEVLNRCMDSPHDISSSVRDALCISTYEIIFLDKSAHAAVDQGVELVRSVAPRAAGLANAVLRRVVATKNKFPFGNPKTDIAAYARLQGFPSWLAARLVEDLGENNARTFMEISNETPPTFVAVNALKTCDEEVVSLLEAARGNPEPATIGRRLIPGCYRIKSARVLQNQNVQRALKDGWFLVSDAAPQMIAYLALPQTRPNAFLEIGAGRGTKTIMFQSNAWRKWEAQIDNYVALDSHEFKVSLLMNRIKDYNVNVSQALVGSALNLDTLLGKDTAFDVVFIDAPCSGLGTLRRHVDIRWRLTPDAIDENAQLGTDMLKSAARFVRDGGTLAYSTCTVTPEENEDVIESFLESEQGEGFYLDSIDGRDFFRTSLVTGGNDAHFLAKLRKGDESGKEEQTQ